MKRIKKFNEETNFDDNFREELENFEFFGGDLRGALERYDEVYNNILLIAEDLEDATPEEQKDILEMITDFHKEYPF